MKLLAFSGRTAKEILRDPLNLAFGIGFPVVLLLLLSAIQANIPVSLFEIQQLAPGIQAVGVFVKEDPETVVHLLEDGVIDVAQLHGGESEAYIRTLRQHTHKPILQAFRVDTPADLEKAQASSADYILLDSGDGGTGERFDWSLLAGVTRPYFLAGGLDPENVGGAVEKLKPYAVDVSSGIETDGKKDPEKMKNFVRAVRGAVGEERDT